MQTDINVFISHEYKPTPTISIAKDVRWLQLQVVYSDVAVTRKQPVELQPPPPPKYEKLQTGVLMHQFGFCISSTWCPKTHHLE